MQLKFGHEYFRSFQKILAKWKNQKIFHNEKCTGRCNSQQTPKHLLIECIHQFMEIQRIKNEIESISMKILFNTKIGMKQLIKFLTTFKIVTKKWILGTLDDEMIDIGE